MKIKVGEKYRGTFGYDKFATFTVRSIQEIGGHIQVAYDVKTQGTCLQNEKESMKGFLDSCRSIRPYEEAVELSEYDSEEGTTVKRRWLDRLFGI